MTEPRIVMSGTAGFHNDDLDAARERLQRGKAYRNLATVMVVPTRGVIPARVVESWMGLMTPMNHPFVRMFVSGMEVGDAYNVAVESILAHPMLSTFPYLLTVEEDNIPPPDGLLRLYESIDEFDIVAGLYWTKGEGGQPMIYGDPKAIVGFAPQVPIVDAVQECNGTGMGFTLWRMDLFRDERIPRPWFKTVQEWSPDRGAAMGTQDLYFMGNARKVGRRIASDNRVRVGHYDHASDIVW
jgi:hypothetical protein